MRATGRDDIVSYEPVWLGRRQHDAHHFCRHGFRVQAHKLACVHVSCSLVSQSTQRKADASSHEDDGPYARVSAHDDALVIANSVPVLPQVA